MFFPRTAHALRLICAGITGLYMLIDGITARVTGSYIGGTLGPWATLVRAVHMDPRSYTMNDVFALFGVFWLTAIAFYLTGRRRMLAAMAVATLWYLPVGTLLSAIILVTYVIKEKTRE